MEFSATIPEDYREDFRPVLLALLPECQCKPNISLWQRLRFAQER
ncbi:hypothetical protein [Chromobacterium sphagni]|nr:hypothetical protein [Chromobacterium sphagni]